MRFWSRLSFGIRLNVLGTPCSTLLSVGSPFVTSNILWHVPFFYELALNSPGWHQVEHLCFFLEPGFCSGGRVVLPWPSRSRAWPRWAMIPYLVLADLQNTALAAFLTFYDRVLYPTYEHAPRLWGSEPPDDQVIAGTIMWVPGSIIFPGSRRNDCHSVSLAEVQVPAC